jgi:hypothetical protein
LSAMRRPYEVASPLGGFIGQHLNAHTTAYEASKVFPRHVFIDLAPAAD